MTSLDDSDDFGLSSSDEAELLGLGPSNKENLKRKADDVLDSDTKRPRMQPGSEAAVTISNKILKERFRIDSFRLKQEAAICRLLDGGSSVVVFPTGGGKSLCYQVPALCFKHMDRQTGIRQGYAEGGITLVVSPLIALMKDQVDALHAKGISAAVLDSTKSKEAYLDTMQAMRDGTLDILYCAPERLNNEGFVAAMANVKGGVRMLAVDEAHCISEWGHAFRPDYLKIARFCREIQAERVVCLTATASPKVAQDICKAFHISEATGLFKTTTYRPNLRLRVQSYETKKQAFPNLLSFLKAYPGPTIIYVTLQKHTEELAERLCRAKLKARPFHAGMRIEDKLQIQDEFMASEDQIICATIAFGMGVDKANLRNVVHYDLPRSLEGYSQEIGRAGRDGHQSQCLLFLVAEDFHIRETFARGDLPSKKSVEGLLSQIFALNATKGPLPVVEANLAHQSKEFDVKMATLGNIYAQLELQFQLLRATTPKYTKYSYATSHTMPIDRTPTGLAIQNASRKAAKWRYVDVEVAAQNSGVLRMDIVAKLNDWNDRRLIELKSEGVINVYRVTDKWPPTSAESKRIVDDLYKDLMLREQQDLDRMEQVKSLVTGVACFAHTLARHFGDTLTNGQSECGHCTWCETKQAVQEFAPPKTPWNSDAFSKVLEACPDRDDARYLARVAFGIGSPRVSANKLSKHPVFGSMDDHEFKPLLTAFQKICDR